MVQRAPLTLYVDATPRLLISGKQNTELKFRTLIDIRNEIHLDIHYFLMPFLYLESIGPDKYNSKARSIHNSCLVSELIERALAKVRNV